MANLTTPDAVLSGSGWMQETQSGLVVLGGDNPGMLQLTSSYRYVLLANCGGGGGLSLTLPAANSVAAGFDLTIKNTSTGPTLVAIYTESDGDLVEGLSSYGMRSLLQFVTFISDGVSNWYVVNAGGSTSLRIPGGLGVFGTPPPTTQPALCVTLADCIAVLVGCGLCASS
jgi:hypothetical protein